jgi:hypothetical protein
MKYGMLLDSQTEFSDSEYSQIIDFIDNISASEKIMSPVYE